MKMTKNIFESFNKDLYTLYIVRLYDETESFYKIGVTSRENPYDRFSVYPYEKDIICLYQHPSSHLIMDLESKCISLETKYLPIKDFAGKSECVLSVDNALEFLNSLTWIRDLKEHIANIIKDDYIEAFGTHKLNYGKVTDLYIQALNSENNPSEYSEEEINRFKLIKKVVELDSRYETLVDYIQLFGIKELVSLEEVSIQHSRLSKKVQAKQQENILKTLLQMKFSVDEVYSARELKELLEPLYVEYKLTGIPKGSDINLAFETIKTSRREDGKLVNALKLIKKL